MFAFIGNNPTKYFNWDKFNTLGLLNDERGGDACGRVVNDKVVWGVDKVKKYVDLICEINNTPLRVKSNTVLGHCRKASSGGKMDIYAQPVVLFKSDLDMTKIKDTHMISGLKSMKDTDIVFSGIHNGTIENYLDLAEKYGIETLNHNDSRVLLSILFYGNHKVLKEYEGTAALIWQNHVLNKTYIFKGESKSWSSSVDISEERPLFAWTVAENNWYISSLENSLKVIQNTKAPVVSISTNTLYKFLDGVNYSSEKYDRSNCTQNKVYKQSNQIGYNYSNKNSSYFPTRYRDELEYERAFREYDSREKDLPWEQKSFNYRIGEKFTRPFSFDKDLGFRITSEMPDKFNNKSIKKAIYNKTRYWMQGGLMHGVYTLSQGGLIPTSAYSKGMTVLKPYYFVEGILMDGLPAYRVAMKLHVDFIKDIKDPLSNNRDIEEEFVAEIAKYSRFPVAPLLNYATTELCFAPRNTKATPTSNLYTGKYQPLFSERFYKYELGELISIEELKDLKSANHDSEDDVSTKMYLNDLKVTGYNDSAWCIGGKLLNFENTTNPMSPFQSHLINNCNFYGLAIDEEITFIIYFMRDFNDYTMQDCRTCVNKDTPYITVCHRCMKLRNNLNLVKETKFYGIYD